MHFHSVSIYVGSLTASSETKNKPHRDFSTTLPSVYNHRFSVMHTRGSYSLTFTDKDNSPSLSGTDSQTNNFTCFSQGHIIKQSPSSLGAAIFIQRPKNNYTESFQILKI